MSKVMQWRRLDVNTPLTLYYKEGDDKHWKHYTTHPLKQPDSAIPGASMGYPTMQKLLTAGYRLVPTDKQGDSAR